MDLRPRNREAFSGFTQAEIGKMEQLLKKLREENLDEAHYEPLYKKTARSFNSSKHRAGKPIVKWSEVKSWFENELQNNCLKNTSPIISEEPVLTKTDEKSESPLDKVDDSRGLVMKGDEKDEEDLSSLKFEAKSSKDGAWYDVEKFMMHRFLQSGESEVRVRYAGFGPKDDEWLVIKEAVRERSITLEDSECMKVNVGDSVLCFQERDDQARYFDASVLEIERKMHDIRGCRCVFLIRYEHDNTEERVRLKELCCRPNGIFDYIEKS